MYWIFFVGTKKVFRLRQNFTIGSFHLHTFYCICFYIGCIILCKERSNINLNSKKVECRSSMLLTVQSYICMSQILVFSLLHCQKKSVNFSVDYILLKHEISPLSFAHFLQNIENSPICRKNDLNPQI